MPHTNHIHIIQKILLQYSRIRTFGTLRPNSFQISCYPTTKAFSTLLCALQEHEANGSSWLHNITSKALEDKGKQQKAATDLFLVLDLSPLSSVKACNCDVDQRIHLFVNASFHWTHLPKHYILNTSSIYKDRLSHFLENKARASLSTAKKIFFQATFLPVCKQSWCRRCVTLTHLVSLSPLSQSGIRNSGTHRNNNLQAGLFQFLDEFDQCLREFLFNILCL